MVAIINIGCCHHFDAPFWYSVEMLERRLCPQFGDRSETPVNPVVLYVSPLLGQVGWTAAGNGQAVTSVGGGAGVQHGFSTRLGGVSTGPFASLNLGNPNGHELQDSKQNLAMNYRCLHEAAGIDPYASSCRVHQVHGADVVRLSPNIEHDPHVKADAIVSGDPSRVLSVRVADCVPVLLSSGDGGIVAAVHAGWRGIVAGVIAKTVIAMTGEHDRAGGVAGDGTPTGLVAAIGPSIGMDAFEVGPEVVEEFGRVFPASEMESLSRRGKLDRHHIDLRGAVRKQLLRAGLLEHRIDTTDRCTHRDSGEFFSHRRENGLTGRMVGFIMASGAAQRVS